MLIPSYKYSIFEELINPSDLQRAIEVTIARTFGSTLTITASETREDYTWQVAFADDRKNPNFLIDISLPKARQNRVDVRFLRQEDIGRWFHEYFFTAVTSRLGSQRSLTKNAEERAFRKQNTCVGCEEEASPTFHQEYPSVDTLLRARLELLSADIKQLQFGALTLAGIEKTPEPLRTCIWSESALQTAQETQEALLGSREN